MHFRNTSSHKPLIIASVARCILGRGRLLMAVINQWSWRIPPPAPSATGSAT